MFGGLGLGYVSQAAYRAVAKPRWWVGKHTWASVLIGGAVLSTLGAVFKGDNITNALDKVSANIRPQGGYAAKVHEDRKAALDKETAKRDALLARLDDKGASGAGTGAVAGAGAGAAATAAPTVTPDDHHGGIVYNPDPFAKGGKVLR
jgi:hypothetical protein